MRLGHTTPRKKVPFPLRNKNITTTFVTVLPSVVKKEERDKMRYYKYILLTILVITLLGAAFFAYKYLTYSERMEEYGYELMQKIDAYKTEHGHYPRNLSEIDGVEVDFECNYYKDGVFLYTLANDSTYWLEYSLDAENNRGISSTDRVWTEDYVISIEPKPELDPELKLRRLILHDSSPQRNH